METEERRSMEVGAEFSPPEDVLADILDRLPHRDLALSRQVCSSWRTLVDTRRLLLPHALPHSVRGFFLNYRDGPWHHFFARPASSTAPRIDGKLALLPDRRCDYTVMDHRNGLILVDSDKSTNWYVANPATRWWACLPSVQWRWGYVFDPYLVFEPTVSPHYEVWLVPSERWLSAWDNELKDEPGEEICRKLKEEWPPSPCVLHVLSSKTGRWEKRGFAREGAAAGTVADLKKERDYCSSYQFRQSAYWKGTLYVHRRGCYIMRLSLADNKYRVIKTPANIDDDCHPQYCLGNSKNGVYFAAIYDEMDNHDLKVWILEESVGQASWVLKHDVSLESTALNSLSTQYSDEIGGFWSNEFEGAWNLEDSSDDENCSRDNEDTNSESVGGNVDWNSDDDDVFSIVDEDGTYRSLGYYLILGFHPYKEVIFLAQYSSRDVAYHFNSSKAQYLGTLGDRYTHSIIKSLVYTPCTMGEHPETTCSDQLND